MSPTVLIRRLLISFFLAIAGFAPAIAQTISVNGVACSTATVTYGAGTIAISTPGCSGTAVVGTAPQITSGALPTATVGVPFTFQFTAIGTQPVTWTVATGALPAGLTLNSSTGVLSGTPTTTGSVAFTVQAANNTAPNATQSVTMQVNPASGPPVLASTASLTAALNVAYSYTFAASGAQPITWAVTTGAPPAWATFINATGVLSGTPPAGSAGSTPFTVTATNSAGSTPQVVTLTVSAPVLAAITGTPPSGSISTPYAFTFGATGTTPLTWGSTGTLPPGVVLNTSTGVLSGTPTTAGTYTFAVQATNAAGTAVAPASGTFSVTIGAFVAQGTTSMEGTLIPVPSKLASQASSPVHSGKNGAGAEINAWAVDPARCNNTSPAIVNSWHHNIDFADYGNNQKLDHFDMAPNEALTYEFTATTLGYGMITIGTTTFAPLVANFISLSTKPCDFDKSKLIAGATRDYCYASAAQDNGLQYEVTNAIVYYTCKLVPGQKYYLNIRWQDGTAGGANTSDSCTYPRCGGYLQIRR